MAKIKNYKHMKQLIVISLILASGLVFVSCNNNEKTTNKKKELLGKEAKLLQKSEFYDKSIAKNNEVQRDTSIKNNFLISNNKVGKFQIGQKAPSSLPSDFNIRKETRMVKSEGEIYEESLFVVSENGLDLLTYSIGYYYKTKTENVITEIKIISDKFKTIENIGIGSTIEDFEKVYPDFKIWYTYTSEMYVIETRNIKAQFILSKNDFIGNLNIVGDIITLNKTDFKANSKIKEIRII